MVSIKQKSQKAGEIKEFFVKTNLIKIKDVSKESAKLVPAAESLRKGGLVAFPTETVYGLGADALNKSAVNKIFLAKGRPSDNPFIVHIADRKDIYVLAEKVPKIAEKLIERFWPGPLTLVLKKAKIVPFETTGGRNTIAIRMPNHPVALALIIQAGVPVAAPSANISSKPSATSAKHVIDDLNNRVDFIVDGGDSDIGVESTVLDLTSKTPLILRPGKITIEDLKKVMKDVKVYKNHDESKVVAKSPGMKYKHYSPDAKIIIVEGSKKKVEKKIMLLLNQLSSKNKKVKVLSNTKRKGKEYYFMGGSDEDFAKNMFKAFRHLDKEKTDFIIAESVSESGIGAAVMNRMKKAAFKVIKV